MSVHTPTPARLEAFSDGVIAVIITVMVLELHVPHGEGWAGLRTVAPAVLVYLLSFAFTGTYWLNHQHVVRRTERAGHPMQLANLGFLFCLSLLPFSTAYVVEKEVSGFAVALYDATLTLVAISFVPLRLAIHGHLVRADELSQEDRKGLRNHLVSVAIYAGATALAPLLPKSMLACAALLTLFWLVPNLTLSAARRE